MRVGVWRLRLNGPTEPMCVCSQRAIREMLDRAENVGTNASDISQLHAIVYKTRGEAFEAQCLLVVEDELFNGTVPLTHKIANPKAKAKAAAKLPFGLTFEPAPDDVVTRNDDTDSDVGDAKPKALGSDDEVASLPNDDHMSPRSPEVLAVPDDLDADVAGGLDDVAAPAPHGILSFDFAKTGRSRCLLCTGAIERGALRWVVRRSYDHFDRFIHHACWLDGELRPADWIPTSQSTLKRLIEEGAMGVAEARAEEALAAIPGPSGGSVV